LSSEAFTASLPFILRWEGGFVDDPDDRGGRTNKGVTQKTYAAWRSRRGLPPADVKDITAEEVAAIYEESYWLPPRCDLLQYHLDLAQFDTAVNMGAVRAIKILQAALGCPVDGDFGPRTEGLATSCDVAATIANYCNIREGIYRRIAENDPTQKKFLKGWLNRLNALRAEAGVPGFAAPRGEVDFGDTGYIAKVPDLAESADLEPWR
jgi:lysozyme family protein